MSLEKARLSSAHLSASRQPYADLASAVLVQAVDDYRLLKERGLVRGRDLQMDRWHASGAYSNYHRFCQHTPAEARQLIEFLTGPGWQKLVDEIGIGISQKSMFQELGLA